MAQSKIGTICDLIKGTYQLGDAPLHDYYVAREVVNALRCRSLQKRYSIIKLALHPYRVMVSLDDGRVRIWNPETRQGFVA